MQSLENKSLGNLFENDMQVQAGSMSPLPINNTFSAAQSPTQSTVFELTLNTNSVPVANQFMNRRKINVNEVSVQGSTEKAKGVE